MVATLITSTALASEGASPSLPTYEGPGCSTAEEAAQLYLDGLKNSDLSKMLSAFAMETYVDNFDFTAQLQRNKVYWPSMTVAYPNANSLFRDINVESRKQDIVSRITMQLVTFCIPDFDVTGSTTHFESENADSEIHSFVNRLQEGLEGMPFERLQLTGFTPPTLLSEIYSHENLQQNMALQANILGAYELRSVVADFTVDGKPYVFYCNALRYGEKWYLESLGSHIAGLLDIAIGTGGIMPVE